MSEDRKRYIHSEPKNIAWSLAEAQKRICALEARLDQMEEDYPRDPPPDRSYNRAIVAENECRRLQEKIDEQRKLLFELRGLDEDQIDAMITVKRQGHRIRVLEEQYRNLKAQASDLAENWEIAEDDHESTSRVLDSVKETAKNLRQHLHAIRDAADGYSLPVEVRKLLDDIQ